MILIINGRSETHFINMCQNETLEKVFELLADRDGVRPSSVVVSFETVPLTRTHLVSELPSYELDYSINGWLARVGKVRSQTPKVSKQRSKKPTGCSQKQA